MPDPEKKEKITSKLCIKWISLPMSEEEEGVDWYARIANDLPKHPVLKYTNGHCVSQFDNSTNIKQRVIFGILQ